MACELMQRINWLHSLQVQYCWGSQLHPATHIAHNFYLYCLFPASTAPHLHPLPLLFRFLKLPSRVTGTIRTAALFSSRLPGLPFARQHDHSDRPNLHALRRDWKTRSARVAV